MTERKQEGMENLLHHGDNLDIFRRHLANESIELDHFMVVAIIEYWKNGDTHHEEAETETGADHRRDRRHHCEEAGDGGGQPHGDGGA